MADNTLENTQERQQLKDIIGTLEKKIPAKQLPLVKETFSKILVEKMSPKQAMNFPPEVLELLYQQGYLLFQSGKYKDALTLFNFLRMLDGEDKRYSFSIAACHHHSNAYLEAAANYLICNALDPDDPVPSFHIYDCYMKAGFPEAALFYLEQALILAKEDPKYEQLGEKIQLELEYMKEFLKERYQKKTA